MKSLLIAVLALALNASAGVVTVERINETIQRESGGNPHAIGRNGEVGLGQLKPGAVRDLRDEYEWTVTPGDRKNAKLNRIMTEGYLVLTERRLRERLGRQPTWREVEAAYIRGVDGFLKDFRQGIVGVTGRGAPRIGLKGT